MEYINAFRSSLSSLLGFLLRNLCLHYSNLAVYGFSLQPCHRLSKPKPKKSNRFTYKGASVSTCGQKRNYLFSLKYRIDERTDNDQKTNHCIGMFSSSKSH